MTKKKPSAPVNAPRNAAAKPPKAPERAKPTTLEQAQKILAQRRSAVDAAIAATSTARAETQEATSLLRVAVRDEKYAEAERLKNLRDNGEQVIGQLRATETAARTAFGEALQDAENLFFADQGDFSEQVRLCRVVVADPVTGATDSEVYTDSSETIQLRLGDERNQQFESEAYHVSEWAAQHGYFVKVFETNVPV
ncbi:hypothetical protein WDL1P1_00065 (plasmid) [Variovorax sp. WDL1]|nr:hypothetical protein CHC06_05652 [Variovorax sp. B2]PNG50941.1 hypothetical protein CHC07_05557 [Variovorax sp. B4]VTV17098.1 hypothetical protein WDL1P1_00065 [Variovorax sp. WDL1]